jgi:hypothetical protein
VFPVRRKRTPSTLPRPAPVHTPYQRVGRAGSSPRGALVAPQLGPPRHRPAGWDGTGQAAPRGRRAPRPSAAGRRAEGWAPGPGPCAGPRAGHLFPGWAPGPRAVRRAPGPDSPGSDSSADGIGAAAAGRKRGARKEAPQSTGPQQSGPHGARDVLQSPTENWYATGHLRAL